MFATVRESLEYAERMRGLFGSSVIAYNPIWEGGGDKAYDISGHGCHGIRTAVAVAPGIGDGRFSGSFNGTTSFVNWYSPALAARFNDAEGTLMARAKVANAGVWTDGLQHVIARISADGNNLVWILKQTTNNTLQVRRFAGGVGLGNSVTTSILDWFHMAITWSVSQDKLDTYYGGTKQGSTLTNLGTFVGALSSTLCCVGAGNTTPTTPWSGLIAHALLLNRAATAAEIAEAYRMAF